MIYKLVLWKPVIDVTSDVTATNACAPLFYSCLTDSLQQVSQIAGQDIICNPCFAMCTEFVNLLTAAFEANKATRALLIIPARD